MSLELLGIQKNLSRVYSVRCSFVLEPQLFPPAYVYFFKIKNKSMKWLKWEPINICGAISYKKKLSKNKTTWNKFDLALLKNVQPKNNDT